MEELALVTLGNRMGHCMGLRTGYSTVMSFSISVHVEQVDFFAWVIFSLGQLEVLLKGIVFIFLQGAGAGEPEAAGV